MVLLVFFLYLPRSPVYLKRLGLRNLTFTANTHRVLLRMIFSLILSPVFLIALPLADLQF